MKNYAKILFFFIFYLWISTDAYGAPWIFVENNDNYHHDGQFIFPDQAHWSFIENINENYIRYYDTKSIRQISKSFFSDKNILSVWTKEVLQKKNEHWIRNDLIKIRRLLDLPIEGFGSYRFTTSLWEVQCSKNVLYYEARIIRINYYNEDGNKIAEDSFPNSRWMGSGRLSLEESTFKKICPQ